MSCFVVFRLSGTLGRPCGKVIAGLTVVHVSVEYPLLLGAFFFSSTITCLCPYVYFVLTYSSIHGRAMSCAEVCVFEFTLRLSAS